MKSVRCPQCGKTVAWEPAAKFRPFCSARCRVIDLGAWADESYRVPAQEESPGLDELGMSSDGGRQDR